MKTGTEKITGADVHISWRTSTGIHPYMMFYACHISGEFPTTYLRNQTSLCDIENTLIEDKCL